MNKGKYKMEKAKRDPKWAQPIKLDGVPNLFKVTSHIYRSAQPTGDGFNNLKDMGIKTIINLRALHNDSDTPGITELDSDMTAWHIEDEDVIYVLRTILGKGKGSPPYLVHCRHGADRTGLIMAMFRIIVQGWSKDEAIDEMKHGGYGFHSLFSNIVTYIQAADISALKKEIYK
jgi:protein tyrosine/serine phosphatase